MAGGGKFKIKGGIASKNEVQVINGAMLVTGIIGLLNYSLLEQDTGQTWVDGSAIFQKTIDVGALPNTGVKNVAHNIAGFGLMIRMWGNVAAVGVDANLPFVQAGSNGTTVDGIQLLRSGVNIEINAGVLDRSALSGFVTIQYTKV